MSLRLLWNTGQMFMYAGPEAVIHCTSFRPDNGQNRYSADTQTDTAGADRKIPEKRVECGCRPESPCRKRGAESQIQGNGHSCQCGDDGRDDTGVLPAFGRMCRTDGEDFFGDGIVSKSIFENPESSKDDCRPGSSRNAGLGSRCGDKAETSFGSIWI